MFLTKYSSFVLEKNVDCVIRNVIYFSLALQLPWALASFQFHGHFFTDGIAPWMSDQLVARPLSKYRTQTHTEHPCLV
jgi:hypothetical protein